MADNDNGNLMINLIEALQILVTTRDKDEALKLAVEWVPRIVNGEGASVWLVPENNPDIIVCAATHNAAKAMPGDSFYSKILQSNGKYDGLTAWVFARGEPLRINNMLDEAEIPSISDQLYWTDKFKGWAGEDPLDEKRPFLGVPLFSARRQEEVIGVLRIATTKDREPFSPFQQEILQVFAAVLSLIISNAQRREDEENLLISLTELGATPKEEEFLQTAVDRFQEIFSGSECSILLLDDNDGKYHIRATSASHLKKKLELQKGITESVLLKPYVAGEGKTGTVIKTRKSVLVNRKRGSKSARPGDQCEIQTLAKSFMAAPLLDEKKEQVIGVIRSPHPKYNAFTSADRELLESYAGQVSFLLNVIRKYNKLIKDTLGSSLPIPDLDTLSEFTKPTERVISIMYVDLKGSTDFGNTVLEGKASFIIDTLNLFFDLVVPPVIKFGGTIDKFEGDGFIALFNAFTECKSHALRAVQCAMEMRTVFDSFKRELRKSLIYTKYHRRVDKKDISLGLKVGIGTAKLIVGQVGLVTVLLEGTQRYDYTFIGHDANLTSRLISDVPLQIDKQIKKRPKSERQKVKKRQTKRVLVTGETFESYATGHVNKRVRDFVEEYEQYIVEIRGAGIRGEVSQERRIFEILKLTAEVDSTE